MRVCGWWMWMQIRTCLLWLVFVCGVVEISCQTPTATPTLQLQTVYQSNNLVYDGTVTLTITNTYAIRNCGNTLSFACTACPSAASNIQLTIKLNTTTSCKSVANWWTPQYGWYNLTSLGYTYEPNPKYASINSIGYYGGFLRLYKIPYQSNLKSNFPQNPNAWNPNDPTNTPPANACAQPIRQFEIMPLSKCPSSNWSSYTTNTALTSMELSPVIPLTEQVDQQIANIFPDTMTWLYYASTGNQVLVGTDSHSLPGNLCSPDYTGDTYRSSVLAWGDYTGVPWKSDSSFTSPAYSSASCFTSDCVTHQVNYTNEYPADMNDPFGFQATFNFTGFPYASCPPLPLAATTTSPTTATPTTIAPTQAPTLCNDTEAAIIQQQCATFNTTALPIATACLSFISPLLTPLRTSLTSSSSLNNYTLLQSFCNINTTWITCVYNTNISTTCKTAVINQTTIVYGNTTLPNCTSLTAPTSIPTSTPTTSCTIKQNITTIPTTTKNVRQIVFYYDNDVLANGSYCGINSTYNYLGCILPSITLNNHTTYTWNDSMICNITSIPFIYNQTIVTPNITCMNGTYYNNIIVNTTTGVNITYPNGTYILNTTTSVTISNITVNTNISCIITTMPPTTAAPTLTPSTDVTAAPTTATSTTQDKAAGTAMALILGFSSLGVGILYWVWFRARKAKANWHATQQHVQQQQHQQQHEQEEEEI